MNEKFQFLKKLSFKKLNEDEEFKFYFFEFEYLIHKKIILFLKKKIKKIIFKNEKLISKIQKKIDDNQIILFLNFTNLTNNIFFHPEKLEDKIIQKIEYKNLNDEIEEFNSNNKTHFNFTIENNNENDTLFFGNCSIKRSIYILKNLIKIENENYLKNDDLLQNLLNNNQKDNNICKILLKQSNIHLKKIIIELIENFFNYIKFLIQNFFFNIYLISDIKEESFIPIYRKILQKILFSQIYSLKQNFIYNKLNADKTFIFKCLNDFNNELKEIENENEVEVNKNFNEIVENLNEKNDKIDEIKVIENENFKIDENKIIKNIILDKNEKN
jgi:hypothetical protein